MEDCIFCKIVKGEIPSYKIWEDEKHLAFLNIFPNTPGFTIIVTKKHYPSYAFNADDKVLSDLVLATKKVARLLDLYFQDAKRCGMFLEGLDVDHLHSKLAPMHGLSDPAWKEKIKPQRGQFYTESPGYLTSQDSERADDKELAGLAEKIRKNA
jgi:histidine triad (HIT) family protein